MTARPNAVRAMLLIGLTALLLLVLTGGCDAEQTEAPGGAGADATNSGAAAKSSAYDLLERYYALYTTADDPLGFPMKVRNLSANPYRFWRGSKELFYEWCRTNAADWLADQGSYLRIHGDLHPGNMGIYLSQGDFGQHVAFGAVDFDESARLPFQLELLQGAVTLKMLADHRRINVGSGKLEVLVETMLEAYRTSLDSDRTPTQLLEDDKWVGALLKDVRKREYSKEIEKYVHKGQFVSVIEDKSERTKELLQPAKGRGEIADAIETALTRTPDGADLFKTAGVSKKSILDVARRTQLESAGSEGLHKYLVLFANKSSAGKRLILYLKQQIPTAAERVGIIPTDSRPAGQRAAEDAHDLSRPPGYFNGWCPLGGGSYRLTIKEPWSETLDGKDVDTFEDLKHFARIWGTVAGSLHRQGGEVVGRVIKSCSDPQLATSLRDRGSAYASKAAADYRAFVSDPRSKEKLVAAEAAVKAELDRAR